MTGTGGGGGGRGARLIYTTEQREPPFEARHPGSHEPRWTVLHRSLLLKFQSGPTPRIVGARQEFRRRQPQTSKDRRTWHNAKKHQNIVCSGAFQSPVCTRPLVVLGLFPSLVQFPLGPLHLAPGPLSLSLCSQRRQRHLVNAMEGRPTGRFSGPNSVHPCVCCRRRF